MGLCCVWGAYIGLIGRLEVKKPLGRHGHIWEGSMNMDLE
jgi:hypothetical protein